MSGLWVKRRYDEASDEDAIVYLWLKSYAHAWANKARGANVDKSDAELAYWREHAPIVESLLRHAHTEVLCDPERSEPSSKGPAVLFAFACTTGDVVHYVSVKRAYAREGFGPDMLRDLLGSRLDRACTYTHELPELRRHRDRPPTVGLEIPSTWRHDPWWTTRQLLGGARKVA